MTADLADTVMERINALAGISEEAGRLTRTFASPAMKRANDLVGSWMREAGMAVHTDAVGNLIGRYAAAQPDGKTLLLGSHLDTVRDAGKFDGPLGVLIAIACVQRLNVNGTRLPFAVEVIGFADEEGVRYQTTYLGSRALAGTFNKDDLERTDSNGVTMAEAIREFGGDPIAIADAKAHAGRLLGYAEAHIEQGPVLQERNLSVGVVTAISGQSRIRATFVGKAGHAGTVPMNLRHDALCGAAEFILRVEAMAQGQGGLVATVGEIAARPGASNVIPGEVSLSIDVRHPDDAVRRQACKQLSQSAHETAGDRQLTVRWEMIHETDAVVCGRGLTVFMRNAVQLQQSEVPLLSSGAGHDAAAMSAITPVTMLFIRCKDGISHHPAESASHGDISVAIETMSEFLRQMAQAPEHTLQKSV